MRTYAIFLRGVTPTGRNRVPMAELRAALAAAGLREVRTYIQSGNAVAKSPLGRAALEALVHDVIARKIGADVAVIALTHEGLRKVVERNPFLPSAASRTYFTLLASRPEPALAKEFQRLPFAPDDVRIIDDTIYALYATRLSASKFHNNVFERKLKVVATTRNFNTMTRVLGLAADTAKVSPSEGEDLAAFRARAGEPNLAFRPRRGRVRGQAPTR